MNKSYEYSYDMTKIRKHNPVIKMMGGWEMEAKAGLFVYEGLGLGSLYLDKEGSYISCCRSDASYYCQEQGWEYEYVDSFMGYRPIYVGD